MSNLTEFENASYSVMVNKERQCSPRREFAEVRAGVAFCSSGGRAVLATEQSPG